MTDQEIQVLRDDIKTNTPDVSRELLEALGKACSLIPAYTTSEWVDAVTGFAQVVLRDKSVQEAFVKANLHLFAKAVPDGAAVTPTGGVYFNIAEMEHKAEEAECVAMCLDERGAPKADADGKEFSLWGRVMQYTLSRAIPEGHVVVPKEPTEEMQVAFAEQWFSKRRCIDDCEMEDAYRAMIAAAQANKEGT